MAAAPAASDPRSCAEQGAPSETVRLEYGRTVGPANAEAPAAASGPAAPDSYAAGAHNEPNPRFQALVIALVEASQLGPFQATYPASAFGGWWATIPASHILAFPRAMVLVLQRALAELCARRPQRPLEPATFDR